jgi:hypothetical protein
MSSAGLAGGRPVRNCWRRSLPLEKPRSISEEPVKVLRKTVGSRSFFSLIFKKEEGHEKSQVSGVGSVVFDGFRLFCDASL